MSDIQANQLVAAKSGAMSIGGMVAMAVSHILSLPSWVQMAAAVATMCASFYAIRLSRVNIKKVEAELKILRAKAAQLGVSIDD